MSCELTHESFRPRLGQAFQLEVGAEGVPVELIEATAFPGRGSPAGRDPFALVFRGPRSLCAGQGTYTLRHEALGALELFLVPIGPDGEGMRLEAVFN